MKELILITAVLFIAGCAGMPGMSKDLQKETARSLVDVREDTIEVSSITRVATSIKWEAETANGHYSCSADSELRQTLCVKRPIRF
jgi:hypothetical protein